MQLNTELKKFLQKNNIGPSQLSRDTGVPVQTIHNWLTGLEPRKFDQVKSVADYFGVTIDRLCYGSKPSDVGIEKYGEEINAGVYEVVLRKIK